MSTFITLKGTEYELATTLRVAFKVQGQHAHKPYAEIFASLGGMKIEEQINIAYQAFAIANPDEAKVITEKVFLDSFLDTYNVGELMEILEAIIEGIMGKKLMEKAKTEEETEDEATEEEGN